jgi:hypothetical protein
MMSQTWNMDSGQFALQFAKDYSLQASWSEIRGYLASLMALMTLDSTAVAMLFPAYLGELFSRKETTNVRTDALDFATHLLQSACKQSPTGFHPSRDCTVCAFLNDLQRPPNSSEKLHGRMPLLGYSQAAASQRLCHPTSSTIWFLENPAIRVVIWPKVSVVSRLSQFT